MSAQRWLQVHVVALCVLGSLFVALTTKDPFVPTGVLFAGITSVLFTDTWKWFRLSRFVGNLAAVLAVVYALHDFLGNVSEGQLLAIANLLVYLQVILFYQEKNSRLYWQIILLSLLQVVVGAALHLGLTFGLLLLIYTGVAISTLVLFYIHRETEHHTPTAVTLPAGKDRQTRLLGAKPAVQVLETQVRLDDAFLSHGLLRQILLLTTGSLLFAGVFFYTAPRHPAAAWSGARGFARAESGFSREMELLQMGKLLQNESKVMRVTIEDSQGKPLKPLDPYFAGEVLVEYKIDEERHASWHAGGKSMQRNGREVPTATAKTTTLKFEMDATLHPTLFTIAPVYRLDAVTGYSNLRLDPVTRLLYRKAEMGGIQPRSFSYVIATTGIQDGRQSVIAPHPLTLHTEDELRLLPGDIRQTHNLDRSMFAEHLLQCQQWTEADEVRFAGLKRVAEEAIQRHNFQSKDPVLIARALEDHFHSRGLYTYTLDLNIKRDEKLDPIEDFVINHRKGHCQYFASALVLMLRSQGLPARMVVGYRGSDYNDLGNFYQVRQKNAHAWAEVHLKKEEVPIYETTGGPVGETGAWMRLDATPGQETPVTWFGTARDWLDYVDTMWSDYVVGLNQQRQQAVIYSNVNPDRDSPESRDYMNAQSWQETLRNLAGWLGIRIGKSGERGWRVTFDWRAGLLAIALCFVAIGVRRLVGWLRKRVTWSRWLFGKGSSRRRSSVEFYARLEDLLTLRGRSRRPAETPREFVENAIRELALMQGEALRQLVEAFYGVRFGGRALQDAELRSIQKTLEQLQRASSSDAA